jgi:DNA-binding Lrp family transcriptional regulator
MTKRTLSAVAKDARDGARISQRELAAAIGVKASHIAYIKRRLASKGLRFPSSRLPRSSKLGLVKRNAVKGARKDPPLAVWDWQVRKAAGSPPIYGKKRNLKADRVDEPSAPSTLTAIAVVKPDTVDRLGSTFATRHSRDSRATSLHKPHITQYI